MTNGLEQCFSAVRQALVEKDVCKTHGAASDSEATRRDSDCLQPHLVSQGSETQALGLPVTFLPGYLV